MTPSENGLDLPRRRLLRVGAATLSATGVAALAGIAAPPAAAAAEMGGRDAAAQDVELLNAAVALEHEGIAAYQIALDSGLLSPPATGIAGLFQGHHKQHADELASVIVRLGGRTVDAKPLQDYAEALDVAALKTQTDVFRLALRLERGAANAYLGLIAPLRNGDLDRLVARLAADEVMHTTVFMASLEEQIPKTALIFG